MKNIGTKMIKSLLSGILVSAMIMSGGCDKKKTNSQETDNSLPDDNKSDTDVIVEPNNNSLSKLIVTSNPEGSINDQVISITGKLESSKSLFKIGEISNIQSITFDRDQNAYLTFDGKEASNSGLMLLTGVKGAVSSTEAPITANSYNGSEAPKGLIYLEDKNIVIVADFGADTNKGAIRAYSVLNGKASLVYSVTDLGSQNKIWDVAYNNDDDILYATGTGGSLLIYEDFIADRGGNGLTDEVIPTRNNQKTSVNLHGIHYDSNSDSIILSDVGDATNPSDGKIFVIENISNPSDEMEVSLEITGSRTDLGNPVDILFDNGDLYVAEKSNDKLMMFENLLNNSGLNNIKAKKSLNINKPESLSLTP